MNGKLEIKADMVTEAYEALGMKPVFDSFGDGVTCGCGLTALASHHFPDETKYIRFGDWSKNIFSALSKLFETDQEWVRAFARGFDDMPAGKDHEGYRTGAEAREKVLVYIEQKKMKEDEA
jgi:hypothetical protein